jgi:hypothetical protein
MSTTMKNHKALKKPSTKVDQHDRSIEQRWIRHKQQQQMEYDSKSQLRKKMTEKPLDPDND